MNRWLIGLALLAAVLGMTACSDPYGSPTQTLETMHEAAKAEDEKAVMACYSKKTQELMVKMKEISEEMEGKDDASKYDKSKTMKDAKIEIGDESVSGNEAKVKVKVDGHSFIYRFVLEDGDWKLDMSEELEQGIQLMESVSSMKSGLGGFLKALSTQAEE